MNAIMHLAIEGEEIAVNGLVDDILKLVRQYAQGEKVHVEHRVNVADRGKVTKRVVRCGVNGREEK
jgi:hypothetical protein